MRHKYTIYKSELLATQNITYFLHPGYSPEGANLLENTLSSGNSLSHYNIRHT
jgi:hypothetical protein